METPVTPPFIGIAPAQPEERDILIAQSYRMFAMDSNVDVLLFTADEDMINHAMSADLEPVFIK
ncbi:unnamed protein product, partial [marine sediment metagenome]